jgi:acetyl esterase/lipase
MAALLSILALAQPAAAAAPMTLSDYMALSGPAPTAHVSYGPAPSQYAELFEPAGPGPFPVVVLVHGGCFMKSLQGVKQMRGMAGALASRGIAVWSIDYRGLDEPGGGYPGTFLDARDALDALASHAAAFHLDTRRLVAVGHSAGAYLVLWVAGRERLPKSSPLHESHPLPVRHVISLGGSGDMRPVAASLKAKCGYDISQITGAPSAARPDVYADTTPAELMPNGSRTLFINGDLDVISPPGDSADYAARVRRAGDAAETLVLPNASHFDEVAVTSPAWRLVLPAILMALNK